MGLEFSVDSAVFQRDLPASAFQLLGVQVCAATWPYFCFLMSWLLADSFACLQFTIILKWF